MVTPLVPQRQNTEYGTARRVRLGNTSVPDTVMFVSDTVVMTTVICDECGHSFAVVHRPAFQDAGLAEQQAIWLKDQFVWDHIQEKKHAGRIRLPGSHEMNPSPRAVK
jgi:hypothetical protein